MPPADGPSASARSDQRVKLSALPPSPGHPRLVYLQVSGHEPGTPSASTMCTVIASSSSGVVLGFRREGDGEACAYVIPEELLPTDGLKLIRSCLSLKGKDAPKSAMVSFREGDFAPCNLVTAEGEVGGFVCVRGPLRGYACDADMKHTLVTSVSYWRAMHAVYRFRVMTEPLHLTNPPSFLPIENVSRLCSARGKVNDVTQAELNRILLGAGARRPFGNRRKTFIGARSLVEGLMSVVEPVSGPHFDALSLTRGIVGSSIHDYGAFVACANQRNKPWRDCVRCSCHVRFEEGCPARSAVDIKTKCLYRSREKRKQEEGENTKTKKKPKARPRLFSAGGGCLSGHRTTGVPTEGRGSVCSALSGSTTRGSPRPGLFVFRFQFPFPA